MLRLDPDQVLRSSLFDSLPWVRHGFGTRLAPDWPGETATLKQVHSDVVVTLRGAGCSLVEQGQGDALVTAEPGIPLSIRTADCVPILVVDPEHRVVSAVHAGWRGTQREIARRTIERMAHSYGSRPESLVAAIGPAIGPCCYEVSQDVAEQFRDYLPEWIGVGKTHLDLVSINRWQLEQAGLPIQQIEAERWHCTRCNPDLYHSFRRDGDLSGRMHAVIEVRRD